MTDSTISLTEVIQEYDRKPQPFRGVIRKEIAGLEKENTRKFIHKSKLSQNANILGTRFDLIIKDEGTPHEIWKARFVV